MFHLEGYGSAVAMDTALLNDLPIVFVFFKSDGDF